MATSITSLCLSNVSQKDELHVKYKHTLEKLQCLINGEERAALSFVDIIQRLSLDHHFTREVDSILRQHYAYFSQKTWIESNDLYTVSLSFRLLRQANFPVTQDAFRCFMHENGKKFKDTLVEDTRGLLALYEASQLGFEEEDILEEAAMFTTRILRSNHVEILDDDQMVKHTLQNPHHKSIAKLIPKNFIENNVSKNEWTILLQDLARMEHAMLGPLFQEEVVQVVKWWNELGLTKELELARDQLMKWHMWSMCVLLDPTMSWQRILLTKPISLVYIVDDIFDIYGTMDQLELFTQTIKRWEIFETEGLPNYMKKCFNAIQETTEEISHIVYKKHGFDPLDILKRSWGKLFEAFLREAKWFASGHLAKAEEYLSNGVVSSGVPMVLSHLFFMLGNDITSAEAEWMLNGDHDHSMLYLVGMILRLYDDLRNSQDEEENGHDGSYLECYMKEFEISSYEVGKEHVMNMVSNTWKKLNKSALSSSNPFPQSFTKACLNVARMVPVMYDKSYKHHLIALQECFKSIAY